MVNVIKKTEKVETIKETFILQISEEQYENEIKNSHPLVQKHNVEKFVCKETNENELSIIDVRYKNNTTSSSVIEIEAERVTKVISEIKLKYI